MPTIPSFLLKQLYVKGSLEVVDGDTRFALRNHLASATITGLSLNLDGREVPVERILVTLRGAETLASDISETTPLHFPLDSEVVCCVDGLALEEGTHSLVVAPSTREIGRVEIAVEDRVR